LQGFFITSPTCKTAEDCYRKVENHKPWRKACSVHKACKCMPLPASDCQNPKLTDCPKSLQCSSSQLDNCEKDSDCQKSIKSCTKKNPCICVSRIPINDKGPYDWPYDGVCVRKSDGCKPGEQTKTCNDPNYPKNPKPCHHPRNRTLCDHVCTNTPFKPRVLGRDGRMLEPRTRHCSWVAKDKKNLKLRNDLKKGKNESDVMSTGNEWGWWIE